MTELGDGPVQEEYRQSMMAVMQAVDEVFNGEAAQDGEREVGVVMLVFPYGKADGARCNFISNGADRKDLVSLFREMAARFEGQPRHEPGTG